MACNGCGFRPCLCAQLREQTRLMNEHNARLRAERERNRNNQNNYNNDESNRNDREDRRDKSDIGGKI